MINRLFFIADAILKDADLPPREENVFYSCRAVSPLEATLPSIYLSATKNSPGRELCLTLDIREPLSDESLQTITALIFLPDYLRFGHRPVVNISGVDASLVEKESAVLQQYFLSQGIRGAIFNILLPVSTGIGEPILRSVRELEMHYQQLFQPETSQDRDIFFYPASIDLFLPALARLKQVDADINASGRRLRELIRVRNVLSTEVDTLRAKLLATKEELKNQQDYLQILRSDHQAKEIQDFYTNEYEVLPLWYKRFGHILKVLLGKRTLRSLFRNNVKNIDHNEIP